MQPIPRSSPDRAADVATDVDARAGRMGAPDAAGASKVGRRRVAWLAAGLCAAIVGLSPGSAAAQSLPAPLLAIDFDRLAEGALPRGVSITTQFRAPDVVPGVIGSAWRTDGFSSHAQADLALDAHQGYTISLWLALESFPSDLEVPVAELSPSSIAQQAANGAGFDLHIDTYGRWGFRVATAAGELNAAAPKTFPLRRWTHVVASVDPASGAVDLYQDGARVASAHGAAPLTLKLAQAPLQLATPPRLAKILQFTINRLNAAYDLVAVYPGALTPAQLALLPGPAASQVPSADRSLVVPESRFAGDFLRPRVHPMPPANWTNEPHGFVRFGDAWHLFYQRTPNGPYKTQMHWGHLTSRDLVHWESLPDALWPELQTDRFGFDMKGIWSGNVIVDGGKAYAFYTSVNHGDRLAASNPGISMAVSDDPQLIHWRKLGPILNTEAVKDFRDPFLWQEGDSWHMLIGAALATGGGLEYLVLKPGEKGARWEVQRRFSELAYPIMDPASVIWEMPVFEQLSDRTSILVVNPIGGKVSKYGDPATRAVYWTGEWSGGLFKPYFRDPKNLDLLPGHLAPTVARAADGTLRAIGIVDERRTPLSQERAGWANAFGLPRVWTLLPDGKTLGQAPAPELRALRGEPRIARDAMPLGREPITVAHEGHAYELLVDLGASAAEPAPIRLDVLAAADGSEYTRLIFDQARQRVVVDKSHASRAPNDEGPQVLQGDYDSAAFGPMRQLHVFVDGSVVEVYINDAAAYAVRSYPSLATSTQLRLSTDGTSPTPVKMQLWPLRDPAGSQRQAITAAAKETQP